MDSAPDGSGNLSKPEYKAFIEVKMGKIRISSPVSI